MRVLRLEIFRLSGRYFVDVSLSPYLKEYAPHAVAPRKVLLWMSQSLLQQNYRIFFKKLKKFKI